MGIKLEDSWIRPSDLHKELQRGGKVWWLDGRSTSILAVHAIKAPSQTPSMDQYNARKAMNSGWQTTARLHPNATARAQLDRPVNPFALGNLPLREQYWGPN